MNDLRVVDFATEPDVAVEAVLSDTVPVVIRNLYSVRLGPLQSVLDSGKEYKNGSWLEMEGGDAGQIFSVNHPNPRFLEERLFGDRLVAPPGHRLWRQFADCVTAMHFDAGMIAILNTQLVGRKKWLLVAPNAPVELQPIGVGVTHRHARSVAVRGLGPDQIFTAHTDPGDTMFIPRFWFHQVWTLEDSVNLDTVMRRSAASLGFKMSFRHVLGACFVGARYGLTGLRQVRDEGGVSRGMFAAQAVLQSGLLTAHVLGEGVYRKLTGRGGQVRGLKVD